MTIKTCAVEFFSMLGIDFGKQSNLSSEMKMR